MSSEDGELEEIRRKKLIELQKQIENEQKTVEDQQNLEFQKQLLMQRILTTEARDRLNRIKIVRPKFVEQIELQLINAAKGGNLSLPINDEQLKAILIKLQPQKKEYKLKWI